MSDLACWRLNHDQLVVRIRGSEHLITQEDAFELAARLTRVAEFEAEESCGQDYLDLCIASEARKANRGTDLLQALGFVKPKLEPIRRRA